MKSLSLASAPPMLTPNCLELKGCLRSSLVDRMVAGSKRVFRPKPLATGKPTLSNMKHGLDPAKATADMESVQITLPGTPVGEGPVKEGAPAWAVATYSL